MGSNLGNTACKPMADEYKLTSYSFWQKDSDAKDSKVMWSGASFASVLHFRDRLRDCKPFQDVDQSASLVNCLLKFRFPSLQGEQVLTASSPRRTKCQRTYWDAAVCAFVHKGRGMCISSFSCFTFQQLFLVVGFVRPRYHGLFVVVFNLLRLEI